jgi:hypothetical protein
LGRVGVAATSGARQESEACAGGFCTTAAATNAEVGLTTGVASANSVGPCADAIDCAIGRDKAIRVRVKRVFITNLRLAVKPREPDG